MSIDAFQSTVVPRRLPLRSIGLLLGLAAAVVAVIYLILSKTPPPVRARSIGARLELAAGQVEVKELDLETQAISGTPLAIGARDHHRQGRARARADGRRRGRLPPRRHDDRPRADGPLARSGRGVARRPPGRRRGDRLPLGKHVVSASDAGLSIARDGDDATVYVARGLAILTSPGGRVEINAGTQGTAAGDAAPKVAPVAFWQDWTGGMGDARAEHGAAGSGSGRIYGIDPQRPRRARPRTKLGVAKQVVRAVLRDGVAETEVDQTFSNPGGQPIEGWYWFTVPADAIVTSFALETNGQLVEGEVDREARGGGALPGRRPAANDPALLEWVDGRSYRARIFPIPASGTRRVVLRYIELLPSVEGKIRYVYPLRSDDPVRFDEFALSVDLGGRRPEPAGRHLARRDGGARGQPRHDAAQRLRAAGRLPARDDAEDRGRAGARLALRGGERSGRLRDAALRARPRRELRDAPAREGRGGGGGRHLGGRRRERAGGADRGRRGDPPRALGRRPLRARRARRGATGRLPEGRARAGDGRGDRQGAREAERARRRGGDRPRLDVRACPRAPPRHRAARHRVRRRRRSHLGRDDRPTRSSTGCDGRSPARARASSRWASARRRATSCSRAHARGRRPVPPHRRGRPDDRARRCASPAPSRRRPSPISTSTSAPGSTSPSTRRRASSRAARSSSSSRARTTRCRARSRSRGASPARTSGASTRSPSSRASRRRSCRGSGRPSTCAACSAAARARTTTARRCSISGSSTG